MPGGLPGGMPGGSETPERSNSGAWREAAELASEAARAEGASIPGDPSNRRTDGSGTAATPARVASRRRAAATREAARWQARQSQEKPVGMEKAPRGLAWHAGQCFETVGWTGGQEPVGSTCIDTSFLVFADEGRSVLAPAVLAHSRGRLCLRAGHEGRSCSGSFLHCKRKAS